MSVVQNMSIEMFFRHWNYNMILLHLSDIFTPVSSNYLPLSTFPSS